MVTPFKQIQLCTKWATLTWGARPNKQAAHKRKSHVAETIGSNAHSSAWQSVLGCRSRDRNHREHKYPGDFPCTSWPIQEHLKVLQRKNLLSSQSSLLYSKIMAKALVWQSSVHLDLQPLKVCSELQAAESGNRNS